MPKWLCLPLPEALGLASDALKRTDTAAKAEIYLEYISDAAKARLSNEVWDGVLKLFTPSISSALAWKKLGELFAKHLYRYNDAEAAFRRVIEIDAKDAQAWGLLAIVLGNHLERYKEAEAAYKTTIELDLEVRLHGSDWDTLQ